MIQLLFGGRLIRNLNAMKKLFQEMDMQQDSIVINKYKEKQ